MPVGASPIARQLDPGKLNRFLVALPADDLALLAPHLRAVALDRGTVLHDAGDEIEHVYFPHSGLVSLVAVMESGATVETVTVGRGGVIGGAAGLGSRRAVGRAIVQLSGAAARIPWSQFHSAAKESSAIHDLVVRHNDLLITQIQQAVACNALHMLEARLCRWLLLCRDCVDTDAIPLTQEFLGQMLGVRRTTVTIAARLLQSAGLIRYRRGLVQILDRPALEDIACECYPVLRRRIDEVFPLPTPHA